MREIRTLRAMWRALETELRQLLNGHEEGNLGYKPRRKPTGHRASARPYQLVGLIGISLYRTKIADLEVRNETGVGIHYPWRRSNSVRKLSVTPSPPGAGARVMQDTDSASYKAVCPALH